MLRAGAERTVVYCDGAVRLGDWAAAAWLVDDLRFGIAAWRSSNPFLAEAKAVELAVRANPGALLVQSDSDSLVRVLTTPTPPNRRKPGRLSHRISDRYVQMEQLREALSGRDVELMAIDGHSAATPLGHRAADLLCRYGMIRLAASGASELVLGADDLAGQLGDEVEVNGSLARACARRLAELGIYHEDQGDGGPDLDWRSGGFEIDGFGFSAEQRRMVRLERLIKWASRRGDLAAVDCAQAELNALRSGDRVGVQMAIPNYRAVALGS